MASNYEHRVVAFLDIMGFSEMVNSSMETDASPEAISRILELIHGFVRDMFADMQGHLPEKYDDPSLSFKATMFSDSIVMSVADKHKDTQAGGMPYVAVALATSVLAYDLLALGVFCRGGIAVGKLIHDENVFGPALIEAYRLETRQAVVPRILFSPYVGGVWERVKDSPMFDWLKWVLRRDEDGKPFLNVLETPLHVFNNRVQHLGLIRNQLLHRLTSKEKIDVRFKTIWYIRYFNQIVATEHPDLLIPLEEYSPAS